LKDKLTAQDIRDMAKILDNAPKCVDMFLTIEDGVFYHNQTYEYKDGSKYTETKEVPSQETAKLFIEKYYGNQGCMGGGGPMSGRGNESNNAQNKKGNK